jgi:hypothetical protein|tara:strand:- start:6091 stop:6273 length:183 start_codon:yes stop_codon:yes gene_type:complete
VTSAVYLMQTVLGVLLIGALNEARDERVTAFWMMLATFAIWAVQWAWRSATYRRVQNFRA